MENIKNKGIEFLCVLEGYHQTLKMLHWSAEHHSLHILTDDIDDSVLDYEDKLAECLMGRLNIKFGIGDLKTLLPESKNLQALLKEMESDVIEFKNMIGEDAKCAGIQNVLDDFMSDINKWNYLRTLV